MYKVMLIFLSFFIVAEKNHSINFPEIIQNYVNIINKDKNFSFSLYFIGEGKDLVFDINNNTFNKNIFEIFFNVLKIVNDKKGTINFILGQNFTYITNKISIKTNNKQNLIATQHNIPFFKKTYKVEDFIGIFLLMQPVLSTDLIQFKIINNKNDHVIVFYRKNSNDKINNFTVVYIHKNVISHVLLSIDGNYQIAKLINEKNFFTITN
jgi:hypothetical protein